MQNAKQAYFKTFSNDHVQVAEKHGDCQTVLMEEDRLTEKDQVELENAEYQQNNDEKYQCPHFPVSTCIV